MGTTVFSFCFYNQSVEILLFFCFFFFYRLTEVLQCNACLYTPIWLRYCPIDILLGNFECYQPRQCRKLVPRLTPLSICFQIYCWYAYCVCLCRTAPAWREIGVHLSGRLSVRQRSSLRAPSHFSSLLTTRKTFKCSLSVNTTNPTTWPVHTTMTHISLAVRTVWSEYSLSNWRQFESLASH